MSSKWIAILVVMLAGASYAQQAEKSAEAPGAKSSNAEKFTALKKKMVEGIDERIGKLEELEECIQAAQDMKALKACRQDNAPPPKPSN